MRQEPLADRNRTGWSSMAHANASSAELNDEAAASLSNAVPADMPLLSCAPGDGGSSAPYMCCAAPMRRSLRQSPGTSELRAGLTVTVSVTVHISLLVKWMDRQ